jgi:predicted RNase H-like HicB family nuclease
MAQKAINGSLPICFMKEKGSFVAFSPALDLSTCGRTFEEAKKNFAEALGIFFEECITMGTLDDVLESCGWEKVRRKGWEPPAYVGEDRIQIPSLITA